MVAANSVRVTSGAEKIESAALVGQTVRSIREDYADVLNIPSDATALVNGRSAENSYVLKGSDDLVFSRPVGQKG